MAHSTSSWSSAAAKTSLDLLIVSMASRRECTCASRANRLRPASARAGNIGVGPSARSWRVTLDADGFSASPGASPS